MAFLDEEGRLFGRINLIDAAVAVFVLALIPLAYGAWLLFRAPDPEILTVTGTVLPDLPKQHVEVQGRNLRPYLRASINGEPAIFLYETSDRAQVELPPLAPGSYYLAFFDDSKEIVRKLDAVTVAPRPPVARLSIEAVVPREIEFSKEAQRLELRGKSFRDGLRAVVGTVDGVYQFVSPERAFVQVPALEPGVHDVALIDKGTEVGRLPRAVIARPERLVPMRLVVRFVTRPEIVQMVERSRRLPPAAVSGAKPPRPVLESYQVTDEVVGSTKSDVVEGKVVVVRGTVRVMANRTEDGWRFNGQPLRAGASFTLTTETYEMQGVILSLEVIGGRAR
jgi:hypothetical protein